MYKILPVALDQGPHYHQGINTTKDLGFLRL